MSTAGKFPTTYDWDASQYLGIKIAYNRTKGWLDWSMPSTLPKYKLRYPTLGNGTASTPMPHVVLPKEKNIKMATPIDESPGMPIEDTKLVQSARLIDYKQLTAVGIVAS